MNKVYVYIARIIFSIIGFLSDRLHKKLLKRTYMSAYPRLYKNNVAVSDNFKALIYHVYHVSHEASIYNTPLCYQLQNMQFSVLK